MQLGREVGHDMFIYRKPAHQSELRRQEADTATRVQGNKESLKERFFENHHQVEVKEKESDMNNKGGVPEQNGWMKMLVNNNRSIKGVVK